MAALKKPAKPKRAKNVPVTAGMLYEFRAEMNSKFFSLDHKLSSHDKKFSSIDERFKSIDKRFDSVDKRFDSVDKQFKSLEEKLMAELHRIGLLVEEQNARNKIVMDQYGLVYDKQVHLEKRVEKLEGNF